MGQKNLQAPQVVQGAFLGGKLFFTHFGWARAGQTTPNVAKREPGGQKPRLAVCFGQDQGWKPPRVGVGRGGKWSQNRHSVHPAQDTTNFRFCPAGRNPGPNGPRLGQPTPFGGKTRSKHDEKAAHTLPEWIRPMSGDSGPCQCPSRGCRAPLMMVLGAV